MKTSYVFTLLFIVSFFSCGEQSERNVSSDSYATYENNNEQTKSSIQNQEISSPRKSRKLKPYKVESKQFGMVFGIMPIPNDWKVVNNQKENILFESTDGVKVYGELFKKFYYSNNSEQNYFYQQNGSDVQPVKRIERVIKDDLKPILESQGLAFIGQFPLHQLAQKDQSFDKAIFKSTPEQKTYQCIVTEWEDKNGTRSLVVLRYFTSYYTSLGGVDWGYTMNAMEAPNGIYEQAKRDYINGLVNFQYNPNWFQANNQYYAQKSQQSNVGHQERMAALRAQGQAIINNGNTYSSISDSNHESWKRRNAMSDAGQAKAVDGIWERSNMYDQNGTQYQVEGYSNDVWKNNNNQAIGSNNTNWNPNLDQLTNSIDWEKLKYSDDN